MNFGHDLCKNCNSDMTSCLMSKSYRMSCIGSYPSMDTKVNLVIEGYATFRYLKTIYSWMVRTEPSKVIETLMVI